MKRKFLLSAAIGLVYCSAFAAGARRSAPLALCAAAAAGLCLFALHRLAQPARQAAAKRQPDPPPPRAEQGLTTPSRPDRRPHPNTSTVDGLVDTLLAQGRYALLLRPQIAESLSREQVIRARDALVEEMMLTPAGSVLIAASRQRQDDPPDHQRPVEHVLRIDPFLLDRSPVTNCAYYEFVSQGGYDDEPLWDPSIWPAVVEFADRTRRPGPRGWSDGALPKGQENCPVVGISWYEAEAYARWVGKRLPIDAEWVKAAGWPLERPGAKPLQRKYPWGDAMDYRRANLWGSQIGRVVPVAEFGDGASAGGARQMVGNVWEWLATDFGVWDPPTLRLETPGPMKSIRGGAFDTYFDNQAACSFQSGENPMARKHNIGFRCALSICDLAPCAITADAPSEQDALPTPAATV